MKLYKNVIFDLDGTLLNTLDDLAESMNAVLSDAGYPVHPVEAYKYFVGDGIEKLVERTLPPELLNEEAITKNVKAMIEAYGRRWAEKTTPYPGIPAMLDQLTQRGVNMMILSNKPHDFTLKTVSHLLPAWRFKAVVGASNDTPKKPDPAGAVKLARKFTLSSSDILYLGDTGTDMLTASRAGMFPVGALWGFRTEKELREYGAKALVRNPVDLLSYIAA